MLTVGLRPLPPRITAVAASRGRPIEEAKVKALVLATALVEASLLERSLADSWHERGLLRWHGNLIGP